MNKAMNDFEGFQGQVGKSGSHSHRQDDAKGFTEMLDEVKEHIKVLTNEQCKNMLNSLQKKKMIKKKLTYNKQC